MTVRPEPAARDKAGSARKGLLCCRMALVGLDCETVARTDREMFDALRKRCAGCEFPDACADDLRDDPSSPVWEAYCPNSAQLIALSGP